MKRAVWLPNWIGDAVMATPALALLRRAFPDDQLIGIFRPPIDQTLEGTNLLDKMIVDETSGKASMSQRWRFAQKLRREECGEILLLTNSFRTAAIACLSGIPRRIGFQRDGRGWLLTDRLTPFSLTVPNPVLNEYLRVAAHAVGGVDIRSVDRDLRLNITRTDTLHWEDFATRHCLDEGQYLCFNSGGAFGAAKHWPVESFAELARQVVNRLQLPVVMLCGPAEREMARQFTALTDHPRIVSLADESISIGLSKAVVKQARAMITTDSGPRHFAAAFGVPVITLFGPTHIAWSETETRDAVHLQLPVDCGPCQQRECPLGHHRCMQELTPDRVFASLLELERRQRTSVAA